VAILTRGTTDAHTPTPEQQAIIDAAKGTTDNICVNALAGAAKTTTLEMLCQAITGIPILSLAFNKRIADEMAKRLPSHVEVRTLNALGHRVWASAIGRKLVLDANKSHKLLRMAIDELPRNRREEAYEDIADTLKWLRLAKRDGWIPKKWRGLGTALATDSWLTLQDEDMTDLQFELFETVMNQSINNAYAGEIDFDDQLYMPVCFGGQWPKFPLVLCDEVQDLSPINHVMLEKLFYKRMIVVGDPWQSSTVSWLGAERYAGARREAQHARNDSLDHVPRAEARSRTSVVQGAAHASARLAD
jgi:superfamily I DNA/RNA helicase